MGGCGGPNMVRFEFSLPYYTHIFDSYHILVKWENEVGSLFFWLVETLGLREQMFELF